MSSVVAAVITGAVMGTLARLYMLRIDYRQYPSYPQGYVTHLTMGLIAAAIGAIAVPAIIGENLAAASFLALAGTQFRDVRQTERKTLLHMETTELVPRGTAYIEGIARVFEARNYLATLTALAGSGAAFILPADWGWRVLLGVVVGTATALILNRAMVGLKVRDVADIEVVPIEFKGPLLTVDGVVIMNVGRPEGRETWRNYGRGVRIRPRSAAARLTFANIGQRQAIAHDAAAQVGVRLDVDKRELTPLLRLNTETGDVVFSIVPGEGNNDALRTAVGNVPILEGAIRKPLLSNAGRLAD